MANSSHHHHACLGHLLLACTHLMGSQDATPSHTSQTTERPWSLGCVVLGFYDEWNMVDTEQVHHYPTVSDLELRWTAAISTLC